VRWRAGSSTARPFNAASSLISQPKRLVERRFTSLRLHPFRRRPTPLHRREPCDLWDRDASLQDDGTFSAWPRRRCASARRGADQLPVALRFDDALDGAL